MSDYIERDKLLEQKPFTYVGGYLSSYNSGFLDCAEEAREAIKNAPAADVAPVRHGRWIRPHWKNSVSCADCSECGTEAHHAEYRGVQKYYKICPKCGAKMDRKEDGHEAG